jgi:H+/gluconate symporter-like permease
MMTSIGLSIGFGIMLGQVLAACGGIHSIANAMLRVFGKEKSPIATGLTGFIASIPVFYDVVYVIIVPLAKGMARVTGMGLGIFVGALVAGAACTHCFVPPTPGPLAVAALLGIDIGKMIGVGLIIGAIAFFCALPLYKKFFLNRGWFNPETDIDHSAEALEVKDQEFTKLPSFGASIFPIVLPVFLILIGTVTNTIMGSVPPIIAFLSDKVVALLLGAIAAFLLAVQTIPRDRVEAALTSAMSASGLVLLITGAGGSLAAVLGASGIGDFLANVVTPTPEAIPM